MTKPIFKISEKVYYNLPDGDEGIVIDCIYSIRHA